MTHFSGRHFRRSFILHPIVTGHHHRFARFFCDFGGAHYGTDEGCLQVGSHSHPPDKKVLQEWHGSEITMEI